MNTIDLVAHNVKRLRAARGWTLAELARAAGTCAAANIESGLRGGTPRTIDALAGAFGVPVSELYRAPEGIE